MQVDSISVPKDGIEREKAYKLLSSKNLPEIVTYQQIHDMFGTVKEPYSEKDDPLIYNMDEQSTADESEAEFSDGVILVYDVGHTGDLDQKFLDEEIEILSKNNFRKGDD